MDDNFRNSVIGKVLPPEVVPFAAPLKCFHLEFYWACLVDISRTDTSIGEEAVPRVPEVEKIARLKAFCE